MTLPANPFMGGQSTSPPVPTSRSSGGALALHEVREIDTFDLSRRLDGYSQVIRSARASAGAGGIDAAITDLRIDARALQRDLTAALHVAEAQSHFTPNDITNLFAAVANLTCAVRRAFCEDSSPPPHPGSPADVTALQEKAAFWAATAQSQPAAHAASGGTAVALAGTQNGGFSAQLVALAPHIVDRYVETQKIGSIDIYLDAALKLASPEHISPTGTLVGSMQRAAAACMTAGRQERGTYIRLTEALAMVGGLDGVDERHTETAAHQFATSMPLAAGAAAGTREAWAQPMAGALSSPSLYPSRLMHLFLAIFPSAKHQAAFQRGIAGTPAQEALKSFWAEHIAGPKAPAGQTAIGGPQNDGPPGTN